MSACAGDPSHATYDGPLKAYGECSGESMLLLQAPTPSDAGFLDAGCRDTVLTPRPDVSPDDSQSHAKHYPNTTQIF